MGFAGRSLFPDAKGQPHKGPAPSPGTEFSDDIINPEASQKKQVKGGLNPLTIRQE
jgi:hypothetical protein